MKMLHSGSFRKLVDHCHFIPRITHLYDNIGIIEEEQVSFRRALAYARYIAGLR